MANFIKGSDLMLFQGTKPMGHATTCSIDLSAEELDTSNKMSGGWADAIPGKKSYTISTEILVIPKEGSSATVYGYDDLFNAFVAGTPVSFEFANVTRTDGADGTEDTVTKGKGMYTGNAIITSLSLKADNGSFVSCSVSLKGKGKLAPVVAGA